MDIEAVVRITKKAKDLKSNYLIIKLLDHHACMGVLDGVGALIPSCDIKSSYRVYLEATTERFKPKNVIFNSRDAVHFIEDISEKRVMQLFNPLIPAIGHSGSWVASALGNMAISLEDYIFFITRTDNLPNDPFKPLQLDETTLNLSLAFKEIRKLAGFFTSDSFGYCLVSTLVTQFPVTKMTLNSDQLVPYMVGGSKALADDLIVKLNGEVFKNLENILFWGQNRTRLDHFYLDLDSLIVK